MRGALPGKGNRTGKVDNNFAVYFKSNSISCIPKPDYSAICCSAISESNKGAHNNTYRPTNIGTSLTKSNYATIKSANYAEPYISSIKSATVIESDLLAVLVTSVA